jgi:serine/threonine-protein kinase
MPILTPDERLGQSIAGRYRLEAVLSSGGMGVLFEATDTTTRASVAVKMLKPAYTLEKERVARFLRETRIAGELKHPNIASVLDVWQDDTGVPFLVMELLRGCSLEEELVARRKLPLSEALANVLPIARALAAAHASGIIHRDVKPANIFLCRDESSAVVPKLLDFGIAKTPEGDFETQTGLVLGTPGYMAPEQAQHGECGPYTDIWAVGAVLYRALTGSPPHGGGSVGDMMSKLVRESVPPLVAPGVGKSVAATIDRALSFDPHRRYGDMMAFVRALSSAAAIPLDRAESHRTDGVTTADMPRVSASALPPRTSSPGVRSLAPLAYAVAGVLALAALYAARGSLGRGSESARAQPSPPEISRASEAPAPAPPLVRAREPSFPLEAPPAPLSAPDTPPRRNAGIASETSHPSKSPLRTMPQPADRDVQAPPQRAPSAAFLPSVPPRAAASIEREPHTGIPVATEW